MAPAPGTPTASVTRVPNAPTAPHRHPVKVRFYELDPYGHLNHSVYVQLFETGRIELLDEVGLGLHDLEGDGYRFVVSRIATRFLVPAIAGDALVIETEVLELRRASSRWGQRLLRGHGLPPGPLPGVRRGYRGLMAGTEQHHDPTRPDTRTVLAQVGRGACMGAADVVPGVSGGTLALLFGIYERLLDAIRCASRALGRFARGDLRGGLRHLGEVDWWFLVPLLVGLLTTVVLLAGVIEAALVAHPATHGRPQPIVPFVVGCAAAFFELLRKKTQRQRLHLQSMSPPPTRKMEGASASTMLCSRDDDHAG